MCGRRGSTDTPIRQYVWGAYIDECIQVNLLVAAGPQSVPAGAYYLLQDWLYRAVALTNSGGGIVEAYDTDAYGNTLIFTGPGPDGVWFTDDDVQSTYGANEIIYCGYRFDSESQLYYVRNRTYNPVLDRWIQRDPIGYNGGINLYGYVESSPVGLFDPNGMAAASGLSAQLSYQFLMQRVNKELKKSSEAITKLKQTVMANLIFSDKAATIELSVSGASPTAPSSLMSVNSLSLKGTYAITHSGGSKTTGTVDLSPGLSGTTPSVTASLTNTPPPGGGFGFGGCANWMSAGASAYLSQQYTALVGGIKTNVSVKESDLANGSFSSIGSWTANYTIPGTVITIGGIAGGTIPIGGGQPGGFAGLTGGFTLGQITATAKICRSFAGGNAVSGQLKWGNGHGYIYMKAWTNSSSGPVGSILTGSGATWGIGWGFK